MFLLFRQCRKIGEQVRNMYLRLIGVFHSRLSFAGGTPGSVPSFMLLALCQMDGDDSNPSSFSLLVTIGSISATDGWLFQSQG
jgi:hypothetical protein